MNVQEAWALLKEAHDFGQFASDFDQPQAKPVREAIRLIVETHGDLESAFEHVYKAYATPADKFASDGGYAHYLRTRVTAAFTLLQYATGRRTK